MIKPYYEQIPPLTPTDVEIIGKYQDTNEQSSWDFNFPSNRSTGRDSYMINNYYRGKISPTKGDAIQIEYYAYVINSAIHNFISTKPITLYRGYTNPTRLLNCVKWHPKSKQLSVPKSFAEPSFISSTSSADMAWYYATKNPKVKNPVISICTYPPKTPMLYLDERESEWLLPPAEFAIINIDTVYKNGKDGLIYYIKKIK